MSVDKLKSPTPGFVAQLNGILTKKRYHICTAFTDQYSDPSYVHFSESDMADETIATKVSFEIFSKSHGVQILHYHCNNGRFAENKFTQHCKDSKQRLTFCPVNQHNSNGRAEKRNRDLQDGAQIAMLHAKSMWPEAINTHLWSYALKIVNDIRNFVPQASGRTPLILFSGSNVQPKIQSHTFGCPVYALDSILASRKIIPKWDSRSLLGIYLGQSPAHSRTVALVMNPLNGLVSPQFHVRFNDTFETLTQQTSRVSWPTLAGFGIKKATVAPKAVAVAEVQPINSAEYEVQELQDGLDFTNVTNIGEEPDDGQSKSSEDEKPPEEEVDDGRRSWSCTIFNEKGERKPGESSSQDEKAARARNSGLLIAILG